VHNTKTSRNHSCVGIQWLSATLKEKASVDMK
jgi:hypothetical protein